MRTLQRQLNRDGTDFRTLTNIVRSQRALELLRDNSMSITRISFELGYSVPAHFIRAFGKVFGTSPADYRRNAYPGLSEGKLAQNGSNWTGLMD